MNKAPLSSYTTNFIQNILRGSSSISNVYADYLQDIATVDTKSTERELLVLALVENWLTGVVASSNTHCVLGFKDGNVNTQHVLDVVQLLKCESIFCEVLLVIPERKKSALISKLCMALNTTSIDEYRDLRKILLTLACKSYPRNIIHNALKLSKAVIDCFIENLTNLLECSSRIVGSWPVYILHLFDAMLGELELIENYDSDSIVLLNKHEKQRVQELHVFCKNITANSKSVTTGNKSENISATTEYTSILKELLRNDNYSSALCKLFPQLSEYTNGFVLAEDNVGVFCKVLLKVKSLFCLLCREETQCSDKENLQRAAKLYLESLCRLHGCEEIVEEIVGGGSDIDSLVNKFLLHRIAGVSLCSQWKSEPDTNKKFHLAVTSINNLYFQHKEMFTWLLGYKDLDDTNTDVFIKCLTTYTVAYSSCEVMERYLSILHQHKDESSMSCLHMSLQQVVINSLPHLTLKSCNLLLTSCKQYFNGSTSLLWSAKYTQSNFLQSLQEVINKLTSNSNDKKTVCSLAQLSIVSPYLVLQGVIDRIFNGTLKHTVIKSVLFSIPSLFELENIDMGQFSGSPVILYLRNAYIKHEERSASSKNLIATILHIIEVAPEKMKSVTYTTTIDTFIMCNLGKYSNQFINFTQTMEILEKLLQQPHIKMLPWHYATDLLEVFVCRDDSELPLESAGVVDKLNSLIKVVVGYLGGIFTNLPDKQKSLAVAATSCIAGFKWNLSFYFYTFFASIGHMYQFSIPESLFNLCECLDESTFGVLPGGPVIGSLDADVCHEEKWMCLFEISYVSSEAASYIVDHFKVVVADDEMCNLVEAAHRILWEYGNIDKAKAVMECLEKIVANEKIEGVGSYLRDDLCSHVIHHGTCFSMLVLIQSFVTCYSDMEEATRCRKQNHIQNYMKIFHLFLLYAKSVKNVQIRSSILLYLFEQLMYITTLLGEFITSILALLLMDIIMAIVECTKLIHKTISREMAAQVLEQCKQHVLSVGEAEHCIPLCLKINAAISKL